MLALATTSLLALASVSAAAPAVAPARRVPETVTGGSGHGLNCLTYRYGGPFTETFGSSTSPLYSFTENGNQTTQLQISAASDNTLVRYNKATDGQIGQFGFKVCESDDGLAYDGLSNAENSMYGHLVWIDTNGKQSCVTIDEPYEGQVPKLGDCSYEDSKTAQSNQYWNFQNYEGQDAILYFRGPPDYTYGPNPQSFFGQPLTVSHTNVTDFAYFKF